MAQSIDKPRWEFIILILRLIISIVIPIMLAILEPFISTIISRPDLQYQVLQPYETSEQAIFGVTIENRGHKVAKNVRVKVETDEQLIKDINFKNFLKQPDLEEGGVGSSYITFRFDRLPSGGRVTAYVITDKFVEPQVYVDSEEGAVGKPAEIKRARPLWEEILLIIGLATIFYCFLGLFRKPLINFLQAKRNRALRTEP